MTETQTDFLLEFFENEKFTGWKNIAINLIRNGQTLTTMQHTDIWWGGIGNFIKSVEVEGGLWEYRFNLQEFLSSEYFRECRSGEIEKLQLECEVLKERLNDKNNQIQELCKL